MLRTATVLTVFLSLLVSHWLMARALSPSLDAVLGDVPQEPELDLERTLSEMDDAPPPPPTRSSDTGLGNELSDLLQNLPATEDKRSLVTAPKPKPKPKTKSDLIAEDIYKMLAEIERDIEVNLTPKKSLKKSDTFGMTKVLQSVAPKSPERNSDLPPVKTKPKPQLY